MARLPPSGVAWFALQEGPTIDELLVDLKLLPMSSEKIAEIRHKLGVVVGSWWQETGQFLDDQGGLEVEDVIDTLMSTAKHLEEAKRVLQAVESGLQKVRNIEAVNKVKVILSLHPAIGKDAVDEYLLSFCDVAQTISHTCRVAAAELGSIKGKRGRKPYHWYDGFVEVLWDIARENEIRARLEYDQYSREPKGRFFELAEGFERLFPPKMRSPSRGALVKRLSGSLKRFHKPHETKQHHAESDG